ncbi:hypothetical protein [Streptomyces europaeiscabiei]|uniref:hypothetical protein n=1 Tax=Streptomyces europaeiscabiei TaxID=146819 RepID=UPI0029A7D943|nr:hypothetical protein [Streptomyces europaeiscabiei]MDX3581997.1 hypothetical protein [Streptomyces europaeiscabiei]
MRVTGCLIAAVLLGYAVPWAARSLTADRKHDGIARIHHGRQLKPCRHCHGTGQQLPARLRRAGRPRPPSNR